MVAGKLEALPEVSFGFQGDLPGVRSGERGASPPLQSRKTLKIHFKKAAKLARFSSLRRVSDDFCTAL